MDNTFNQFGQQSYNPYGSFSTNIVLVTSLEEAIMRTTKPGSDMVYFNQNGTEFYRIKVEYDGRKFSQTFPYGSPTMSADSPVVKADLQPILTRLEALETKIAGGTVADDKPNG